MGGASVCSTIGAISRQRDGEPHSAHPKNNNSNDNNNTHNAPNNDPIYVLIFFTERSCCKRPVKCRRYCIADRADRKRICRNKNATSTSGIRSERRGVGRPRAREIRNCATRNSNVRLRKGSTVRSLT